MKRILCIFLLAAGLGGGSLSAQDLLELKRVELDSLVHYLRKEFQPDIYYVKDEAEQSTRYRCDDEQGDQHVFK